MQLRGSAAPRRSTRERLRRYARAALGVCLLGAPAFADVLPDDRADALYHRYEGGGITIQGPEVLVRKKIGDSLSLSASYYEDLISSASIDVKLSASPYKEQRKQYTGGIDYLHDKTTYSAGFINSKEPDYQSNTSYYSVSQTMFGDLTTLSLSFKRGWDRIERDIKVNGVIRNDPTFHQQADHRGYSLGLSQIITRSLIADFNYEVLTDQGYLANPYRKILVLDPGSGKGYDLADQIYPGTRTSNAASLDLKYYLPWRAAADAQYRFFSDTWGIVAHTVTIGYTQPWRHFIFDGSFRYYRQNAANFFADIYPRPDFANFMARDRELAAFQSYTVGAGVTWEFGGVPHIPFVSKSSVNLRFDHLLINYSDYRNALLIDVANHVLPGQEPLYKLNANVLQLFFSIWY